MERVCGAVYGFHQAAHQGMKGDDHVVTVEVIVFIHICMRGDTTVIRKGEKS